MCLNWGWNKVKVMSLKSFFCLTVQKPQNKEVKKKSIKSLYLWLQQTKVLHLCLKMTEVIDWQLIFFWMTNLLIAAALVWISALSERIFFLPGSNLNPDVDLEVFSGRNAATPKDHFVLIRYFNVTVYYLNVHEIVTHRSSCSLSNAFINDWALFTDQLQKDSRSFGGWLLPRPQR